jgi:methionine salvage enolase-phosphatase E1
MLPHAPQVLFATDNHGEAVAAREAGWQAVLVDRPGNKALPEGHGFRVITSMQDLLQ